VSKLAKVSLVISCVIMYGCSGRYSMIDPAGPAAQSVATLWWWMLAGTAVIVAAVCGLWWFAIRKTSKNYTWEETRHVLKVCVFAGGIGLPTLAIVLLLFFGIPTGHTMLPWPGDNALRIDVHAKQWEWQVNYPDYSRSLTNKIVIPVGRPINVHVTSEDVIHGFWVPRLGGKIDAIPGRTNIIRIQADKPGEYGGQCAEYCGQSHAFMRFNVYAVTDHEFNAWLSKQGNNYEQ